MIVSKFGLLFILLLSLLVVLVFLSRTLNVSLNDNDAKQSKRSVLDRDYFTGKSTEVKANIVGKDLRLRYIWLENQVVTLLIDYTPIPHVPKDSDVIKFTSQPQQNVIKSWIRTVEASPRILLSSDQRYLVFEGFDGISIYDFQEKELINIQSDKHAELTGTSVYALENNLIILGLYEGRGGICDDRALSVDIDTFRITQLQPKSSMQRCQL